MPKLDRVYAKGKNTVLIDAYQKGDDWFVIEYEVDEGMTMIEQRLIGKMTRPQASIAIGLKTGIQPVLISKNRQ